MTKVASLQDARMAQHMQIHKHGTHKHAYRQKSHHYSTDAEKASVTCPHPRDKSPEETGKTGRMCHNIIRATWQIWSHYTKYRKSSSSISSEIRRPGCHPLSHLTQKPTQNGLRAFMLRPETWKLLGEREKLQQRHREEVSGKEVTGKDSQNRQARLQSSKAFAWLRK